jgi:undecaprenyl-diphosphatase
MFFGKLNPFARAKSAPEKKSTWTLWLKVCIASVPAALIGVVGDKLLEIATGKDIDGWIFNAITVAAALIIYGVLFIVVEKIYKSKKTAVESVDAISYTQAVIIGCFQTLSIVPGTSRSGSTILGARFLGVSRPAAAEFSFFLGIPAMVGASLIKGYGFFDYVMESGVEVPLLAWFVLLEASLVAFGVSMVAIRFLMEFVKKHSFSPFGIYRIVLGALVLLYFIPKMV